MLNANELRQVVSMQQRSYQLLLWLAQLVDRRTLVVPAMHDGLADGEAARQWLEANLPGLPPATRPDHKELEPFANLFGSYLLHSFELVEMPSPMAVTDCGCRCPICVRIAQSSHLQPKQLGNADKRRARALKFDHLASLALQRDVTLPDAAIEQLLDDPSLGIAIAMATYGGQLVRRSHGDGDGPTVLALWREFAWTQQGSPDPDFELDAEAVLAAERCVVARIDPTALRVFAIEMVHALPGGRRLVAITSPPGGLTAWEALSPRNGDALEVRRPDGSRVLTKLAGIGMATPNPERRADLLLSGPEKATDVPAGSELWLPTPEPATRR